jgi:hypothetical protein
MPILQYIQVSFLGMGLLSQSLAILIEVFYDFLQSYE